MTMTGGELHPAHSIEALVRDFDVPAGLRPALALHRQVWLDALQRGNVKEIEAALRNAALRSYVRGRYEWDFGALVAVVHRDGLRLALGAEAERGTLTPRRGRVLELIDAWLANEGHKLEHLRVDFQQHGPEAQRRDFVQGLYESVDDLLAFQHVALDDAYDAVRGLTAAYRGAARTRFGDNVRAARRKRRDRTGEATPSLRARGPAAFSVQAFRKTELFKLLRPFFPPAVPVVFQTGQQLTPDQGARLARGASAARAWLGSRRRARRNDNSRLVKAGEPPTAPLELPADLLRGLEQLLGDPRDVRALRAVLTVIAAKVDYDALPSSLGLGSGVAALKRVRWIQRTAMWPNIRAALAGQPATRGLIARLERRRDTKFSRRRRAG